MAVLRLITALALANYGVNILEVSPPSPVTGASSTLVGSVAALPWGEENVPTLITSSGDLFSSFAPKIFGNTALDAFPALKAFTRKKFPGGIWIVRPAVTGAAAGTFTFVDALAADSVTVSARYNGTLGNAIQVAFTVNADDADARDMTVTINGSSVTYAAVCTTTGGLALTDPGDPYVSIALAGGATDVPAAIAATSLAGGDDGTAVAADYTGSVSDSNGIRAFYGETFDLAALFVAECPAGLEDTVNGALQDYCTDNDKGIAVLCSVAGQSKTDAKAYLALNSITDDRVVYNWPRVRIVNEFDADRALTTVDGNAFTAAAIASTPAHLSPGGADGVDFFAGISALADTSANDTDLNQLNAAGVAPFSRWPKGGYFLRRGITADTTAGRTRIVRRRMADLIQNGVAEKLIEFLEKPLDVDLVNLRLGNVSGAADGEIRQYLQTLVDQELIPGFTLDPFGENIQANLDAGEWRIALAVKLYAGMDEIVLLASVGETVQLSELAA